MKRTLGKLYDTNLPEWILRLITKTLILTWDVNIIRIPITF